MRRSQVPSAIRTERYRLAASLALAEYISLREEALHAMDAAASAVKWSLSTYGVLFAAGLLAANEALVNEHATSVLEWIVILMFAGVLPGLVCVGAWTWLGEINRLQRASAQIRSIEARIAKVPSMRDLLNGDPVRQQRYITQARFGKKKKSKRFGKQTVQYVSTGGVFFGLVSASIAVFAIYFLKVFGAAQIITYLWAWAITTVIYGIFIWLSMWLAHKISILDKDVPDMSLAQEP